MFALPIAALHARDAVERKVHGPVRRGPNRRRLRRAA
jgi:hypothetical protein